MAGPRAFVRYLGGLKPPRMRMGHWFALLFTALLLILAAATLVWWGSIREALMDPAVPYQTWDPPVAPDYTKVEAWALPPHGDRTSKHAADVFFVHPTTFSGRAWNAAYNEPNSAALLKRIMIPNYAGPFAQVGRVFAPLYRQASLYTQITLREDARDARTFAYDDVKRAFDQYLAQDNQGRPLIIVGVEQGGLIAARLASEALAQHPDLKARLAAVYLIETPEPVEAHGPNSVLPACLQRDQAHCAVGYLANIRSEDGLLHDLLRHHAPRWQDNRLVALAGAPLLCVNPLIGAATAQKALTDHNLGAANASGLEWSDLVQGQVGEQAHQVGAQCDAQGVLQVTNPRSPSLRGRANWTDSVRVRPYNWFYADLIADAKARLAALAKEAG